MVICVTHRLLCPDDFLERLDRIAAQHPYAIVLREKDLSESEYEALARDCLRICQKHAVPLNLNSQIAVARRIGCDGIHLPFHLLLQHKNELDDFSRVGVSLHSPEEAAQILRRRMCRQGTCFRPTARQAFRRAVCHSCVRSVRQLICRYLVSAASTPSVILLSCKQARQVPALCPVL